MNSGLVTKVTKRDERGREVPKVVDVIYEASASEFAWWFIRRYPKTENLSREIQLRLWAEIAPIAINTEVRWKLAKKLVQSIKEPIITLAILPDSEARKRLLGGDDYNGGT